MRDLEKLIGSMRNPEKGRLIGRNLRLRRENGEIVLTHHSTDILIFKSSGAIRLNNGGWYSVTTKKRMSEYLPASISVWQEQGQWSVNTPAGRFEFENGMSIYKDGTCSTEPWVKPKRRPKSKQIAVNAPVSPTLTLIQGGRMF